MSEIGGAAVQAAGDIGAAIVGGAQSKKEGKRAWRRTKVLNQNQIQWRVADAREAGISPLAALGMSPIGQFPVTGSGDLAADAVRGVGEAAGSYLRGRSQRRAQNAALAESQSRTNEANSAAERNKAEADYYRAQSLNISTRGLSRSPWMGNTGEAQRIYGELGYVPDLPSGPMSPNPPGTPPTLKTPLGDIKLNPKYTPHETGEAAIGESMNVFSAMHLFESLANWETVKNMARGLWERTPIGYLLKRYSPQDIGRALDVLPDNPEVEEARRQYQKEYMW